MKLRKGGDLPEARTTGEVIRLFFRVYDRLGFGFLESVYGNAMAIELTNAGIDFVRERSAAVWYDGRRIGHFRADFVVRGRVAVELKATELLAEAREKQLLNFLRSSNLEVGLLLHFGPKAEFRRFAYSNNRKSAAPENE